MAHKHVNPKSDVTRTPSADAPEEPLKRGEGLPKAAVETLRNMQMRHSPTHATTTIRSKCAPRVSETPDWEELRLASFSIKNHVMSRLPELLEKMERDVTAYGGIVRQARDVAEVDVIVYQIVASRGVDKIVKIKSMVTQEIGLDEYFTERGISAWRADLTEMIVQLSDDMPGHIVVPAIYRSCFEVRAIFEIRTGDAPENLGDEPAEPAVAARIHPRKKFFSVKVAISGLNMMATESGALTVFELEGDGRMCPTFPGTPIPIAGTERTVPTFRDIEAVAQLFPYSAIGERMNLYIPMWTGVTSGDGPQEFHLILLDNGCPRVLVGPISRQALYCICCGLCVNVCLVYEYVGGHTYQSVYPGPIGAILTPQLRGAFDHDDPVPTFPFVSLLCGARHGACPTCTSIPEVPVEPCHRAVETQRGGTPTVWDVAMGAAKIPVSSGPFMKVVGKPMPFGRKIVSLGRRLVNLPWLATVWSISRSVPTPPLKTFRQWMAEHQKEQGCTACLCTPTTRIDEEGVQL